MTTPSSRYGELPRFELPACLEFLKLKQFPLKTFPAVYEPERPTQDTLYIYGPGYRNTAASFDVDCLQIQMYLKFCNVDYVHCNSNEPEASPTEKLPFLATVVGSIYGEEEILNWIKETLNKEKILASEKDQQQSKAFETLVQIKLKAALLFSMWLEPINASEITYKNYFGHVPSPVDKVVSFKQQNKVVQSLLADRDILVREEIYQDAAKALEALSVKLGDDTYFFGSSEPTWLDAVVFSHLHCILSMPQIVDGQFTDEERRQASTLHKLARKHENLVRYSKSIYENWLK